MKPTIRQSRYWKGCKDRGDPFAVQHRWACTTTAQGDYIGFGPTPAEAWHNWRDRSEVI